MTATLIATDLDRTLIYSAAARGAEQDCPVVAVERYEDRDASWMTAAAAATFARLPAHALVVPTTTRTPAQWRRIRLPGPAPRYAVTANGGVLLVDDEPDPDWQRATAAALRTVATLDDVFRYAEQVCRPEWTRTLRSAEDLFCYAVLERADLPAGFVQQAADWADACGWQVSLQGRKLYWVPRPLTKSAAVAEIARRAGTDTMLAAGDSLLDADLLAAADAGIMARHGELAASGWRAEHVRVTAGEGLAAGAEIVEWFRRASAQTCQSPRSRPPGTTSPGA